MSADAKAIWLEPLGGSGEPVELPSSGVLVIGSSSSKAGFVLEGQGVADVHCAVGRTKDGSYALKDLGSEFGTLLNGKPVKSGRISDGDQIAIGSRRLRVREADAKPAQAPPPARASKPAEELPTVPGYRLVRRLGRGAMGEVFLAVQQSLDRQVALKLLDKALADNSDFVRRFQAEARAAAALHHSNVVTVFDVGTTKHSHYLSMEYMDDGSLEDRLKRDGRISSSEVLRVLQDAASGLVYAESRGIVHRDIKPDNLMRNHQGTTKIADLGLAANVEAEGEDVGTEGRKIFGTPHFISPEQVRGERADCRSDLYSLGATAYRLLSGETPYEGNSTREILRAKLKGDPVPITERAPGVDPGVAAIVTRLMQREPGDRFPSASALLAEVERQRAASAQTAVVPPRSGGVPKLVLIVAAVVVVGVVGYFATRGGDEPVEPDPGPGPVVIDDGTDGVDPTDGSATNTNEQNKAANGTATQTPGDDAAERLFEVEAENALLRLDSETLTREERRDRLRELATRYAGTSAATTALDRAEGIESEILLSQRESAEEDRLVSGKLAELRTAARLEVRPLRAVDALRAMAQVSDQEALKQYASFVAGRAALEREVYQLAIDDLEADLRAADTAQAQGDFAAVNSKLTAALARTDLPEFPEGEALTPGAQRILDLRDIIRERLGELEGEREQYITEQLRQDASALATTLAGPDGVEADLRRFDFAAANAKLSTLQQSVGSDEARDWLTDLSTDVADAGRAFGVLQANWSDWKRKTVPDPRERRTTNREAVGVAPEGLRLQVDGEVQVAPWSAYAGNTDALATLFRERLSRDYSTDERRAIAALLTLSAVIENVITAEEMFIAGRNAKLSERESDRMLAAFESADPWLDDATQRERWTRERKAAQDLVAGLLAASQERWTDAVVLLERLSHESSGSLLVRLFSDGTALAPPPKKD
ncbi:MAG: protein kinase [Planctomycetes bacterium]|nr:protein kinase [Planctomycetota bacterium]MCB9905206.1 protein kinase [Planctomycetota bacterium]